MITAIRQVRRAKGLTLEDVAARCTPPTTAQTIGRLETGTRTVSIGWLNRIADALGVTAAELVTLPDRPDLPVAATLDSHGVSAPRRTQSVVPPLATPGLVAVTVTSGVGDYRAGDAIWCETLAVDRFATALHRDVLVPLPAGRFVFGRLLDIAPDGTLGVLPPTVGARPQAIASPPWIARGIRLVRDL
ncbi:XRE family transcriptional regulator [Sphingomonas sp. Leaf17]|uniref:helix-turn-helix domain-containing protein n=1 Tax=Sphingomonas sp. Leaf17 TaxID=1735683 RepID=UPI0006F91337|nr:helix-turn-helix transcriptional regulator [Sphingomonas sp. Leaf17]KQM64179.1 XRE family transcriptional regulator [Sphingomonas sp. Leaf17]